MIYRPILSTEDDIIKSLSYEETTKENGAKNVEKIVLQRCVMQVINENLFYFFWIL